MILRDDLRTDAQICGKFASQASLFCSSWPRREYGLLSGIFIDFIQHGQTYDSLILNINCTKITECHLATVMARISKVIFAISLIVWTPGPGTINNSFVLRKIENSKVVTKQI